ncbi:MAG: hypothetical protein LBL45_09120 [Treponema sp.]|jgi:hypothetical protein|nr:hypothetical protein [Treponema sp.]
MKLSTVFDLKATPCHRVQEIAKRFVFIVRKVAIGGLMDDKAPVLVYWVAPTTIVAWVRVNLIVAFTVMVLAGRKFITIVPSLVK